jgi:aminopeptidase-like protein
MISLIRELYPINRSITGDGVRETMRMLQRHIELQIHEVPTGTKVFDWEIPREWNIRGAFIEDCQGRRRVDFDDNNLHVVGYSTPVRRTMTLDELKPHLHSLVDKPEWIPYRTSYYDENWGFCLADTTLSSLKDGEYTVVIDASLEPGHLTYGELLLKGDSDQEIVFFAHTCHPSLCNDNLSGISLATHLAANLAKRDTRYSYRFIFAPATIGSITWLALNQANLSRIAGGLVLSVIGDDGPLVYKQSRRGHSDIDRAAEYVLQSDYTESRIEPFSPWGYDERQFCSPGINLPMGRLTRTPHGEYPQYHTSADDISVIDATALSESLAAVLKITDLLEKNLTYVNTQPFGEPQLGRRGLYRKLGGYQDVADRQLAMLWVLNQSDGSNSLLDIAVHAEMPFEIIRQAADDLLDTGLLSPADSE